MSQLKSNEFIAMRMALNGLIFVGLIIVPASCVSQKKPTSQSPHYEDLSVYRPKYPIDTTVVTSGIPPKPSTPPIPVLHVNEKVDFVLDSIDRYNLTLKFIDGYTIQVYSGQNREEAMDAKKKLSSDVPQFSSSLQYTQPKFRLTIGKYFNKLEAQKDLLVLRKYFPNSILVPERIPIR